MNLTLGAWIAIIIVAGVGILSAIIAGICNESLLVGIVTAIIIIGIDIALMFGLNWYYNNTASGQRSMKDFHSEIDGGLEREITITAEDGREIFHYEGRVDIETAHTGNANYILFESEEGQRYVIYYGIQDTVLIIEKAE